MKNYEHFQHNHWLKRSYIFENRKVNSEFQYAVLLRTKKIKSQSYTCDIIAA